MLRPWITDTWSQVFGNLAALWVSKSIPSSLSLASSLPPSPPLLLFFSFSLCCYDLVDPRKHCWAHLVHFVDSWLHNHCTTFVLNGSLGHYTTGHENRWNYGVGSPFAVIATSTFLERLFYTMLERFLGNVCLFIQKSICGVTRCWTIEGTFWFTVFAPTHTKGVWWGSISFTQNTYWHGLWHVSMCLSRELSRQWKIKIPEKLYDVDCNNRFAHMLPDRTSTNLAPLWSPF